MTYHRPTTLKSREAALPTVSFTGAGDMFGKQGSSGSGGVEAPDSLRSKQVAKIIDCLGEGPVRGIVGWTKGIYFNAIPLQNADGSYNYTNAVLQEVLGYPDQPVISGFEAQESEVGVSERIKQPLPITKIINNPNTDRVRVTMSVPQLAAVDAKKNTNGTTVSYRIEVNNNGGGFIKVGDYTITGKTKSVYQRGHMVALPRPGPWQLRVTRLTADTPLDQEDTLQNETYWDSYTEIVDAKVNYTNSHCIGVIIDAEQFGSIPSRTYLVDGRIIQVPSNYNPDTRTYTGVWDGTFKNAWSNNPAWVLRDLVVNSRYGLGQWMGANDIDKWALYEISQWCDQPVSNGKGGYEPRFVCNLVINDRREAYDWLQKISSVFRGFTYWNGGQLVAVADQPRSITGIYTAANVVDGRFDYAGADYRSMHNMVSATWADPNNIGEVRLAVAEDSASISRYGIQDTRIDGVGATSETQALRAAKWVMFTDNYEGEVVKFAVGLEGAWCKPGDVIGIADKVVGGERRGGRVTAATATEITLDGTVTLAAGQTGFLSVILGENTVQTMRITSIRAAAGSPPRSIVTPLGSFSQAPKPGTTWVMSSGDLATTTWRVVAVEENVEDGTYSVTAMQYHPDKWSVVEQNAVLSEPDVSNIQIIPPPVTNLKVAETLVQTGGASVGTVATLSWTSRSPIFDVDARPQNGNWQRFRVQTTALDIDVGEGWWEFQVTPVSGVGKKGQTTTIRHEVIGRFEAPAAPQQFRIVVNQGMALFRWLAATEIDVLIGGHYELRFLPPRPSGDIHWQDGQVIIESIPGNSTSAEAFYQVGNYMLRTYDIAGIASKTFALITVVAPDTNYSNFYQVCESPNWTGTKTNTQVQMPQEWLVIGPTLNGSGTYDFANQINMGRLTTTRLTWDMLAFPFYPGEETVDTRAGTTNDWDDWDTTTGQLDGRVVLEIASTDVNPTSNQWSAWRPFSSGETQGWAFKFRATLLAGPGQNIGIERLCILADIRNKFDEKGDVAYSAVKKTVLFRADAGFYQIPSITIAIQQAQAGDRVVLSNKTRTGFDIEILNGTTQVTRVFDWHAMGY